MDNTQKISYKYDAIAPVDTRTAFGIESSSSTSPASQGSRRPEQQTWERQVEKEVRAQLGL